MERPVDQTYPALTSLLDRERKVLQDIAKGRPLGEVLEDLLLAVEADADGGMMSSILFVDEKAQHLLHGAAPSLPKAYNEVVDGIPIGEAVGSCGTAVARGEPVFVSDIATDPLWADFRDLALSFNLRSCWSTPILAAEGEVLGTFAIYYSEPRSPTAADIDLISFVTQTAALAIERYKSDEKLRASHAALERKVLERTQALGVTWQVNPDLLSVLNFDGCFEAVNPAWAKVLGWTENEMLGANYAEFVHPDDLQKSYAAFEQTRRGLPVLLFENRYRRKDGSYALLSWVAVPEEGKLYSTARDITAERAQSVALASTTADLDRVWRNAQDMIVIIDHDGHFKAVNPATSRILGWSEAELLESPLFDFVHPDDIEPTLAALSHARKNKLPTFVNRYRHKDGSFKDIEWVASPEEDLVFAFGRDLTAEREQSAALIRAEDALRQSQKMEAVGQLTGGIAHDFNNMLSVVMGSLDLLDRRIGAGDPRSRRYIQAASDGAKRAAHLTQRLLAFRDNSPGPGNP